MVVLMMVALQPTLLSVVGHSKTKRRIFFWVNFPLKTIAGYCLSASQRWCEVHSFIHSPIHWQNLISKTKKSVSHHQPILLMTFVIRHVMWVALAVVSILFSFFVKKTLPHANLVFFCCLYFLKWSFLRDIIWNLLMSKQLA